MDRKYEQQDNNFAVKKRYVVAFTYFLVTTAFIYALYFFFYLNSYIGALSCLFGTISGLLVLKYGMPRLPYPIVGNLLVAIYSIVLINNSLFTGGDYSTSYWWMTSIPLVSSFLLRKEDTIFWTLVISVIMTIWFFIPKDVWSSWLLLNPEDLKNYHMVGAVTLNILIGCLAFMADYIREKVVNENDQLKVSALQSAKMSSLGEMAGNIAHEINNPLSIISGNSSILRKKLLKLNATEEELKHLDKINETVERITHTVVALKNMSRMDSHQENDEFLLKDVLNDVLEICKERIYQNQISLINEVKPEDLDLFIRGSRVQLSQVILNLIMNAIDSILTSKPSKKEIILESSSNSEFLSFKMKDSGPGVSPENMNKLFQPFFTTKEFGKGTGLGLALSFNIMKRHGGHLKYIDQNQEKYFEMLIPKTKTRKELCA